MGWCCRRTYQEMASLLGKILSPHPLLRAWAANALLRACFPGTHKAPSGTGALIYIYIYATHHIYIYIYIYRYTIMY